MSVTNLKQWPNFKRYGICRSKQCCLQVTFTWCIKAIDQRNGGHIFYQTVTNIFVIDEHQLCHQFAKNISLISNIYSCILSQGWGVWTYEIRRCARRVGYIICHLLECNKRVRLNRFQLAYILLHNCTLLYHIFCISVFGLSTNVVKCPILIHVT